jgi:hypothetical protein
VASNIFSIDLFQKVSSMSNQQLVRSVRKSLSPGRLGTYETASGVTGDEDLTALNLYAWNASIAAALLAPLHLCEVIVRNGLAEAIVQVYGNQWPWSQGFVRSLPNPVQGWSPRNELVKTAGRMTTTGKVIPELKFVFWQKLLIGNHDHRLWTPYLHQVFPNLNPAIPIPTLRETLHDDLEALRLLRNRIAHHEPIFVRDLATEYQRMTRLVEGRCQVTKGWMEATCANIPTLLAQKP